MENYFTLLELPVSFDLDTALLERQYFKFQREYHPDRFVAKPQKERLWSMQKATAINDAYDILKTPLKRAEYLLKLSGIEESKPDEALLAEVIAQREALMEAKSLADIARQEKQAEVEKKRYLKEIEHAFAHAMLDKAARVAVRLKYLEKFKGEIRLRKIKMEKNHAA